MFAVNVLTWYNLKFLQNVVSCNCRGCKAFDKDDLSQTAIRGSRCLPLDPSSANISANAQNNEGENMLVKAIRALKPSATPALALVA